MIQLENTDVYGWEAAIRGMRNPMNSWDRSDSRFVDVFDDYENFRSSYIRSAFIGENDHDLMMRLATAGSVHAKYRRMITVTVDILAPLYWWKEFDTYKVGTVANSCSTMHKIADKEFTLDDFSHEHLRNYNETIIEVGNIAPKDLLAATIVVLNRYRQKYMETKDKTYWWQMIQLLPSSYNQKRTVQLNYEVLANIYRYRKDHKLDEWRDFCKWIEKLPYSEFIMA